MRAFLYAAFWFWSSMALAADPELERAVNTQAVLEELGADGVSLDLSEPTNWKIFSVGTASYDFDDVADRQDALREATLNAKAAMARYLNERLNTSEELDKLVEKRLAQSRGPGGESRSVTKDSVTTTLTSVQSSADAILSGVITLESVTVWKGTQGEARVKLGQSAKTVAAAQNFRQRSEPSTRRTPNGPDSPDEGNSTSNRKSNSDF